MQTQNIFFLQDQAIDLYFQKIIFYNEDKGNQSA
jgi:hypothetical protein